MVLRSTHSFLSTAQVLNYTPLHLYGFHSKAARINPPFFIAIEGPVSLLHRGPVFTTSGIGFADTSTFQEV